MGYYYNPKLMLEVAPIPYIPISFFWFIFLSSYLCLMIYYASSASFWIYKWSNFFFISDIEALHITVLFTIFFIDGATVFITPMLFKICFYWECNMNLFSLQAL